MTIEQALITQLKAHAGLSALVSTRIYSRDDLPQDVTYPAVSIWRVSTDPVHLMVSDPKLDRPVFQVDVWGSMSAGKLALLNVAVQVRAALRDFTGVMGGAGGVTVERVFFEDEFDMPVDPEINTRHRVLQFEVPHTE